MFENLRSRRLVKDFKELGVIGAIRMRLGRGEVTLQPATHVETEVTSMETESKTEEVGEEGVMKKKQIRGI